MNRLRQALLLLARSDPAAAEAERRQRDFHRRVQAAKRGNPRKPKGEVEAEGWGSDRST